MPSIDKPYPSWVLNESTDQWIAPVDLLDTDFLYSWDESNLRWINSGHPVNGPFN